MRNYLVITLLLLTSMNTLKSQELPTIGEVFDFQIGDEFHYDNGYDLWGGSCSSKEIIIDVLYALDSNEVTYNVSREFYQSTWWDSINSIPYFIDTISIEYTNLDSSMFYYDDVFLQDTVHYFDDNLCASEIYGAHYFGDGPEGQFTIIREWGIGIGCTYKTSSSWTGSTLKFLMYYLKDGEECGSPIMTSVGIESRLNPTNISVFPTLFTDFVTIESDNKDDLTIQVYSLSGHEILTKRLTSSSSQLDLSFVPSGSYIYVIRNAKDNQVIKTGKIIKG